MRYRAEHPHVGKPKTERQKLRLLATRTKRLAFHQQQLAETYIDLSDAIGEREHGTGLYLPNWEPSARQRITMLQQQIRKDQRAINDVRKF